MTRARTVVLVLGLSGGLALRLLWLGRTPPAWPFGRPCHTWVAMDGPLGLTCLERAADRRRARRWLARHCPRGPRLSALGPGDRVTRCRRRRMAPPRLATLGLPIAVNRATAAEWAILPGVGPALAARLVAARRRRGRFRGPPDLRAVRGIGPRLLARLRPRLWFETNGSRSGTGTRLSPPARRCWRCAARRAAPHPRGPGPRSSGPAR